MRPSCQSCQRGSFSMADQSSVGEREMPCERPSMARVRSNFTITRPMSKMTARRGALGMSLVSRGLAQWSGRGLPAFQNADDSGKDRDQDHHRDDIVDVLADVGHGAAERVAAKNHGAHPEDASENVIAKILAVGHARGAGHGRAKGSNDGSETREDYGAAAVLLIEIVSALQMFAAEEERVFALVQRGACGAADPI